MVNPACTHASNLCACVSLSLCPALQEYAHAPWYELLMCLSLYVETMHTPQAGIDYSRMDS